MKNSNRNTRRKRASKTGFTTERAPTFRKRFQQWWIGKSPVLMYVLSFGTLMIMFYGLWVTDFFDRNILNPVLAMNATLASQILNLFGSDTTVVDGTIMSQQFSISVKRGCDAVEAIALFTTSVIVFPISFNRKLPGILIGTFVLMTANLIRIISLFLIGLYYPDAFELMHGNVWQVIIVLLVIVLWSLWIQWAAGSLQKNRHSTTGEVS